MCTQTNEGAAPTFKKGFGYHPLTAWIDHGTGQGGGECAVIMLRPGNAGSNTAADHVEIIRRALDQAGLGPRPGRRVLVRADGAGGTKETIELLARRRVSYSVGFTLPDHTPQIYDTIPEAAWTPAYNTDGEPRQGADVAETRRPARPDRLAQGDAGDPAPRATPPGRPAALRGRGRLPAHRLGHQHKSGPARRPRGPPPATGPLPGDRIRCAKDTGLDRFPLQGFAQNRIWCLIVALACDLLAFSQLLALADAPARTWEPRTIRLRLMAIPVVIARHARRTILRYKADHPWTDLLLAGLGHLQALPAP